MEIMTAINKGIQKLADMFTPSKAQVYDPCQDRRSSKRYYIWTNTYFYKTKEDYEDVRIIDISLGGIRFAVNHDRYTNGSGSVLLMHDRMMFNMPVQITWTKRTSGRYEYGARFLEMSEQKQKLLKLYIRKQIAA
jgi:hypothetical protein